MTLDTFTKAENIELKPKVEWDGTDFRGEKCSPRTITYMTEHPKIFQWCRRRSKNTMAHVVSCIGEFCEWAKITPEEWLKLDKKSARDLVWQFFVDTNILMDCPCKTIVTKNLLKSFYLYHNEEHLVFIRGKHDIVCEPKKVKHDMTREVCWKIIHKAKTLRDEALLTFAFESGLRRNAVAHMNYGHYKYFLWFRKEGDEVFPSDSEHGNIALFKVMATSHLEYTWDKKLRGKGINWYYAHLHREACQILREYVANYHQDSEDSTPFWYPVKPLNKKRRLNPDVILRILKGCVERAGLPVKNINFHALRRGFRKVIRNTREITDNEFKEAIMAHKIKSSQEAYFDKNPLEFARMYAYCDFSPPAPEKDQRLAEREKEIESLRKQVLKYEAAVEEAGATTKIEIEPLRSQATREQIQNAFKEFNEDLEQQGTS